MDFQTLKSRYLSGESTSVIANNYNTSAAYIYWTLKRNGFNQFRNRSTGQYNINFKHNYFELIDSPIKAYFVGFIAADGWVTVPNEKSRGYSLGIEISAKDDIILTKLKSELNSDHKIYRRLREGSELIKNGAIDKNKKYLMSSVKIGNKVLVSDLDKYDITPNKTNKINFAKNIPNQYIPAYLLGLVDGDGWWTYHKNKNRIYPLFGLCSNYMPFLEQCKQYLESIINLNKRKISIEDGGGCYAITVQSIDLSKQIYDLLYRRSGCDFYLTRKKNAAEHSLRMV